MPRNVGTADRYVRFAIAAALLIVGLAVVQGAAGVIIAAIAAVPIVTAFAGWCPLYSIFGISTCPLQGGSRG